MNNLSFMDKLDSFDHLVAYHKGAFEAHYLIILNKNILDTSPQQIHEHHIILAFSSKCLNLGNTNIVFRSIEILIHFGFECKLWEFSHGLFKFGSILLIWIIFICCQINFPKGSSSKLSDKLKMIANNKIYMII